MKTPPPPSVAFPRKSARGAEKTRHGICCVGTPASYVHTSTGSFDRGLVKRTSRANAIRLALCRHRHRRSRSRSSLQRALEPLLHTGLAITTPSIRAPLLAIGSNQFQQRRLRRRRPCDNGSLTCPHLPFSPSRTASKKERRRRFALVAHSARWIRFLVEI